MRLRPRQTREISRNSQWLSREFYDDVPSRQKLRYAILVNEYSREKQFGLSAMPTNLS
jgi:hypothetical protein